MTSFKKHFAAWIFSLSSIGSAVAQDAAPPGVDLASLAAMRFPQPVRVGDLIHRTVLQPLESRPILGHVSQVVRFPDGSIKLVVDFGGFLGFHTRPIAVPAEAMVLLGVELEIVDFTPEQLRSFPSYEGKDAVPIAPDETIRMGLTHPSH